MPPDLRRQVDRRLKDADKMARAAIKQLQVQINRASSRADVNSVLKRIDGLTKQARQITRATGPGRGAPAKRAATAKRPASRARKATTTKKSPTTTATRRTPTRRTSPRRTRAAATRVMPGVTPLGEVDEIQIIEP